MIHPVRDVTSTYIIRGRILKPSVLCVEPAKKYLRQSFPCIASFCCCFFQETLSLNDEFEVLPDRYIAGDDDYVFVRILTSVNSKLIGACGWITARDTDITCYYKPCRKIMIFPTSVKDDCRQFVSCVLSCAVVCRLGLIFFSYDDKYVSTAQYLHRGDLVQLISTQIMIVNERDRRSSECHVVQARIVQCDKNKHLINCIGWIDIKRLDIAKYYDNESLIMRWPQSIQDACREAGISVNYSVKITIGRTKFDRLDGHTVDIADFTNDLSAYHRHHNNCCYHELHNCLCCCCCCWCCTLCLDNDVTHYLWDGDEIKVLEEKINFVGEEPFIHVDLLYSPIAYLKHGYMKVKDTSLACYYSPSDKKLKLPRFGYADVKSDMNANLCETLVFTLNKGEYIYKCCDGKYVCFDEYQCEEVKFQILSLVVNKVTSLNESWNSEMFVIKGKLVHSMIWYDSPVWLNVEKSDLKQYLDKQTCSMNWPRNVEQAFRNQTPHVAPQKTLSGVVPMHMTRDQVPIFAEGAFVNVVISGDLVIPAQITSKNKDGTYNLCGVVDRDMTFKSVSTTSNGVMRVAAASRTPSQYQVNDKVEIKICRNDSSTVSWWPAVIAGYSDNLYHVTYKRLSDWQFCSIDSTMLAALRHPVRTKFNIGDAVCIRISDQPDRAVQWFDGKIAAKSDVSTEAYVVSALYNGDEVQVGDEMRYGEDVGSFKKSGEYLPSTYDPNQAQSDNSPGKYNKNLQNSEAYSSVADLITDDDSYASPYNSNITSIATPQNRVFRYRDSYGHATYSVVGNKVTVEVFEHGDGRSFYFDKTKIECINTLGTGDVVRLSFKPPYEFKVISNCEPWGACTLRFNSTSDANDFVGCMKVDTSAPRIPDVSNSPPPFSACYLDIEPSRIEYTTNYYVGIFIIPFMVVLDPVTRKDIQSIVEQPIYDGNNPSGGFNSMDEIMEEYERRTSQAASMTHDEPINKQFHRYIIYDSIDKKILKDTSFKSKQVHVRHGAVLAR